MKRRAPEVIRKSRRAQLGRGRWRLCMGCGGAFFTRWVDAYFCAPCAADLRVREKGSRGELGSPLAP